MLPLRDILGSPDANPSKSGRGMLAGASHPQYPHTVNHHHNQFHYGSQYPNIHSSQSQPPQTLSYRPYHRSSQPNLFVDTPSQPQPQPPPPPPPLLSPSDTHHHNNHHNNNNNNNNNNDQNHSHTSRTKSKDEEEQAQAHVQARVGAQSLFRAASIDKIGDSGGGSHNHNKMPQPTGMPLSRNLPPPPTLHKTLEVHPALQPSLSLPLALPLAHPHQSPHQQPQQPPQLKSHSHSHPPIPPHHPSSHSPSNSHSYTLSDSLPMKPTTEPLQSPPPHHSPRPLHTCARLSTPTLPASPMLSNKRQVSSPIDCNGTAAKKRKGRPPYTSEQDDFIRFVRDDLCHSWDVTAKLYNQHWHADDEGKREIPGLQSRYYRLFPEPVRDRKKELCGRPELGLLSKTNRRYWWMIGMYTDEERVEIEATKQLQRELTEDSALRTAGDDGVRDIPAESDDYESSSQSDDFFKTPIGFGAGRFQNKPQDNTNGDINQGLDIGVVGDVDVAMCEPVELATHSEVGSDDSSLSPPPDVEDDQREQMDPSTPVQHTHSDDVIEVGDDNDYGYTAADSISMVRFLKYHGRELSGNSHDAIQPGVLGVVRRPEGPRGTATRVARVIRSRNRNPSEATEQVNGNNCTNGVNSKSKDWSRSKSNGKENGSLRC